MIDGVSRNSHSIYVPMVQTGFLKSEFDSTYPIHLNGIISQEDFYESINRINRTISSNKTSIILAIIFGLSIIGGMTLFIVGGVTAVNSLKVGFPVLIGVGIAVTVFGATVMIIGCCIKQCRRVTRMRKAIATESMEYASRSPTPCSWRLDNSRNYAVRYGNDHNSQLVYQIVIDIGLSLAPGSIRGMFYPNQVVPEPIPFFQRQNNYSPPPYSSQSVAGFCPQCGARRQDLTARFCSSCGQAFDKY